METSTIILQAAQLPFYIIEGLIYVGGALVVIAMLKAMVS